MYRHITRFKFRWQDYVSTVQRRTCGITSTSANSEAHVNPTAPAAREQARLHVLPLIEYICYDESVKLCAVSIIW